MKQTEIEMEILNEDKKKIVKKVPENLASLYTKQGWKVVEKKSVKLDEKPLREER